MNTPKEATGRSFLHCISKHLGRHYLHLNHNNTAMYKSQDDINSSTDSFSLSFDHSSRITGSSIDLSDDRNSNNNSGSSSLSTSPSLGNELCSLDAVNELDRRFHFPHNELVYAEPIYSQTSESFENVNELCCTSDEDENLSNRLHLLSVKRSAPTTASTTPRSTSSSSKARISLSSSVVINRLLRLHLTTTANNATRSFSCSNTNERDVLNRPKTTAKNQKTNQQTFCVKLKSKQQRVAAAESTSIKKKNQSILRPPIQYVYMKGMSGLYSRVPSYSVCCSTH